MLARTFTWDADVEWTSEANPETFTDDVAKEWREAGVNRISMGAQTFNEESLRWMGRMHGVEGPARAFRAARAAGIDNISIDLIFGLPARFQRDWAGDLARVVALEPEHISLYGLTAEKNTPLGRWVAEGRETMADDDQYVEEYTLAVEVLTAAGFEHYEVSNFGRPGSRAPRTPCACSRLPSSSKCCRRGRRGSSTPSGRTPWRRASTWTSWTSRSHSRRFTPISPASGRGGSAGGGPPPPRGPHRDPHGRASPPAGTRSRSAGEVCLTCSSLERVDGGIRVEFV